MLWMTLLLFLALVAAGVVALYVAFPHRGESLPMVPGVGKALRSAVRSIPLVEDGEVRDARAERSSSRS